MKSSGYSGKFMKIFTIGNFYLNTSTYTIYCSTNISFITNWTSSIRFNSKTIWRSLINSHSYTIRFEFDYRICRVIIEIISRFTFRACIIICHLITISKCCTGSHISSIICASSWVKTWFTRNTILYRICLMNKGKRFGTISWKSKHECTKSGIISDTFNIFSICSWNTNIRESRTVIFS